MSPALILRLALDFTTACLFLIAFAYNGLGNTGHEIAGTALFLLLIGHNIFNRRWYGTVLKSRREARGHIARTITLALLTTMLALLATSLVISQTVFSVLPLTSSVSVRQLHTLLGYLTLIIVSLHLGMSWSLIMAVARARLGVAAKSRLRSHALRATALIITACGIDSLFVLDVGARLLMQEQTDFGAMLMPTSTVLARHAAILGLGACVAHYAVKASPAGGQPGARR